jgi:hypothetical protein
MKTSDTKGLFTTSGHILRNTSQILNCILTTRPKSLYTSPPFRLIPPQVLRYLGRALDHLMNLKVEFAFEPSTCCARQEHILTKI